MKTRFTSLVTMKKDLMEQCERTLLQANEVLREAENSLREAYEALSDAVTPASGRASELLQSRSLLDLQRGIVDQRKVFLAAADIQVIKAREALQQALREYEKFKYLETEEIRRMLAKRKRREQRELDEIGVQNFSRRREG